MRAEGVALVMENVAACIVTRGDHDLTPIYHSIADAGIGFIKTWDNSKRGDLSVYGRYAMIAKTEEPLIYVQDDDVVLPPESIQALIDMWDEMRALAEIEQSPDPSGFLVANQPDAFRHSFYEEHCLVGFGAVFRRDLPERAFHKFTGRPGSILMAPLREGMTSDGMFLRTCDIVFTALTPRVLLDLPYENLPWAEDETRMFKQNGHVAERTRMLELVRQVRDA